MKISTKKIDYFINLSFARGITMIILDYNNLIQNFSTLMETETQ